MVPYVNLFVNEQELDVVLGLADQCYGCGLCATSSPESAVAMQPF